MRLLAVVLIALAASSLPAASAAPSATGLANRAEEANEALRLAELKQDEREAEKQRVFKEWKQLNSKAYADGSTERGQDQQAYSTWSANLDDIVAHNKQDGVEFFKGLNQFSDLTFDQFRDQYLMNGRVAAEAAAHAAELADIPRLDQAPTSRKLKQTVPTVFDWRQKVKVLSPQDQGRCGLCWAFASVAALEIKALADGTRVASGGLSEEQMLDCINSQSGYWSLGCSGGYVDEVFKFVGSRYATTSNSYPYVGTASTCLTPPGSTAPSGSVTLQGSPGYAAVTATPSAIMSAVATTGPVTVYFNAGPNFSSYSSGIFPASQCSADGFNHALLVVGYNATAGVGSADSYWILRNSWGTGWGEGGYARVQMTADTLGACRMYDPLGLFVPLRTATPSNPKPPPPPSSSKPSKTSKG